MIMLLPWGGLAWGPSQVAKDDKPNKDSLPPLPNDPTVAAAPPPMPPPGRGTQAIGSGMASPRVPTAQRPQVADTMMSSGGAQRTTPNSQAAVAQQPDPAPEASP